MAHLPWEPSYLLAKKRILKNECTGPNLHLVCLYQHVSRLWNLLIINCGKSVILKTETFSKGTFEVEGTFVFHKKLCSDMLMSTNFCLHPCLAWLPFIPWSESTLAHRWLSELWPFRTSRSEVTHNLPITIPVITHLTFHWRWLQMSSHNM